MNEEIRDALRDHHQKSDRGRVPAVRTPLGAEFQVQRMYWKTAGDLRKYVRDFRRPAWAEGVTIHHTYRPLAKDWAGSRSIDGLVRYYRNDLGWDRGPHLFLVHGSNGQDGIWQLTPLSVTGIHAGACNATHWGIEVVGDFDAAPWPAPLQDLIFDVSDVLLDWAAIQVVDAKTVRGHRECLKNKSCPGKAIDVGAMRTRLAEARIDRPPIVTIPEDRVVIGAASSITEAQFLRALQRNGSPLTGEEALDVFRFALDLEVDPAFFLAVWVQEGGRPLGSSPLQSRSHCPINVRAGAGDGRPTVDHAGGRWLSWETFKLGSYYALLHLKNLHGWAGRHTVRQIIPVHAPASDGNNPDAIAADVLHSMRYMAEH